MYTRKNRPYHINIVQLKSIIARVKDQINMKTLTVAIRQQCIQQQEAYLKEPFLTFFLRCQAKLKRTGNIEWNRVINCQIKTIISFQKLQCFFKEKFLHCAFAKIQRKTYLDEQSKAEATLYEQFSDLRDMQISEDVKIKTRYFFKWCKFIEQKKVIKVLKNKEIQDLKKSKTFHQYSNKFNSFMKWKQYTRRIRSARQKGYFLEEKGKTKILKNIFSKIKQKTQIISIEKLLQQAILNKLQNVRIQSFLTYLQVNYQSSKKVSSYLSSEPNIWKYRFYLFLSKKGFPLMNKSSVIIRKQVDHKYGKICLLNAWKGLKAMNYDTTEKIQQIRKFIRYSKLNQFIKKKDKLRKLKKSSKQLNFIFLKTLWKYFTKQIKIKILKQNQLVIKRNNIKNHKYLNCSKSMLRTMVNHKSIKLIQQKKTQQYKRIKIFLFKKRIINEIKRQIADNRIVQLKISKIKINCLIKLLLKRFYLYQKYKQSNIQFNTVIKKNHHNRLMKYALKGLKNIKNTKCIESQILDSVFLILQNKLQRQGFDALQNKLVSIKKIERLVSSCQFIVLKISFKTILNKLLSKKLKIKAFRVKQENRLKQQLFDMFINYRQTISQYKVDARKRYINIMKKIFIKSLNFRISWTIQMQKTNFQLQKRKKSQLFNNMRFSMLKKKQIEQKQLSVYNFIKSIRFNKYLEVLELMLYLKQEQKKQFIKIKKNYIKYGIKKIQQRISEDKNRIQMQLQHEINLDKTINIARVKLMTSGIKQLIKYSHFQLTKKMKSIDLLKYSEFVKQLLFNFHSIKFNKIFKVNKSNEIINNIRKNEIITERKKQLSKYIKKKCFLHTYKSINQHLIIDTQQITAKTNIINQQIISNRQKTNKIYLVSKIIYNFELKKNIQVLQNKRKKQNCKEMIKLYLKQKSVGIKQFLALRHYASKLKRKAMRGFNKIANNSLMKENRTQVENHTKIMRDKSLDNARKKSKLIETIQRYNMSRISRVIR